jgi:CheY-like chemotaxis protein
MIVTDADIRQANLLIVDDQEANIILLKQLLGQAGYTRVASTMEPREVCELHRNHHYDLILLDLEMPGMDGFQVMDGLKAIGSDPCFPVLVITAEPGHKLRALWAGARDFISKPFDLIEIKTRIHNMLEVRLLYRKAEEQNRLLEQKLRERTAELRESEARHHDLTAPGQDGAAGHRPRG